MKALCLRPKQKFLARLEAQPELNKKVAITLPRLSFELSGISYDSSRKLSPITTDYKKDGKNVRKIYTPNTI